MRDYGILVNAKQSELSDETQCVITKKNMERYDKHWFVVSQPYQYGLPGGKKDLYLKKEEAKEYLLEDNKSKVTGDVKIYLNKDGYWCDTQKLGLHVRKEEMSPTHLYDELGHKTLQRELREELGISLSDNIMDYEQFYTSKQCSGYFIYAENHAIFTSAKEINKKLKDARKIAYQQNIEDKKNKQYKELQITDAEHMSVEIITLGQLKAYLCIPQEITVEKEHSSPRSKPCEWSLTGVSIHWYMQIACSVFKYLNEQKIYEEQDILCAEPNSVDEYLYRLSILLDKSMDKRLHLESTSKLTWNEILFLL